MPLSKSADLSPWDRSARPWPNGDPPRPAGGIAPSKIRRSDPLGSGLPPPHGHPPRPAGGIAPSKIRRSDPLWSGLPPPPGDPPAGGWDCPSKPDPPKSEKKKPKKFFLQKNEIGVIFNALSAVFQNSLFPKKKSNPFFFSLRCNGAGPKIT